MKTLFLLLSVIFVTNNTKTEKPALVDYDAFQNLTNEVATYRKDRLINFKTFTKYSKSRNTIILDTRSAEMFARKHIKGALNLNFSDFTQVNLASIIPNQNTRIIIYCNNNIDDDQIHFTSKMVLPKFTTINDLNAQSSKVVTLALNVPTFINLYGYGYKNVYELSELVSVKDNKIKFEGTDVRKS